MKRKKTDGLCQRCNQIKKCWLFEMSEPVDDGFECRMRLLFCARCAKEPGLLPQRFFPEKPLRMWGL